MSLQEQMQHHGERARLWSPDALLLIYCVSKIPFAWYDSHLYGNPVIGFSITMVRESAGLIALVAYYMLRKPRLHMWLCVWYVALCSVIYFGKLSHVEAYRLDQLVIPNQVDFLLFFNALLRMADERKRSLFRWCRTLLLLACVSGLVIYTCILLDVGLPYTLVDLGGRGFLYRNYMYLAFFTDYTIFQAGPFNVARLCGPFEEPGMLGTWLAFFIAADVLLLRKPEPGRYVLILLGLVTLSLAFVVIGLFTLLYNLTTKESINKALLNGLVIVCAMALYFTLPGALDEALRYNFFSRMRFNSETHQFEDASRSGYHERFMQYIRSADAQEVLIGNGYGANQDKNLDGHFSTIHGVIFDIGLVGFSITFGLMLYSYCAFPLIRGEWRMLLIGVGCVASFYQRAEFFSIYSSFVMVGLRCAMLRLPRRQKVIEGGGLARRVPGI